MNRIQKLMIICIAVILIIAIILVVLLKSIKDENDLDNTYTEIEEIEEKKGINIVEDYNEYYSVLNSITGYYMGIGQKDNQKVYDRLDKDYITENGISIENVLEKVQKVTTENPYYSINKMYKESSKSVGTYYIWGQFKQDMFEKGYTDTYFIVYVDNYNATYAVEPIEKQTYEKVVKEGKNIENKEIEKNNNNAYNSIVVNEQTITTQLLYNYKSLTQDDVEMAFEKLDKEYRRIKFNDNINEYKQYINSSNIKYIMLSKYQKQVVDDYTQYTCIDQKGNYYIFREISPMQYTVILDTYTIDLPEFTSEYAKASDNEKVLMNVQRVFDAINDGDYKYAYSKLDTTFKNNNFKTLESFTTYMQQNFFNKNKVTSGKTEKQNDIYISTITINNENDATKKVDKSFVMQLKEGTDFVMSFNVN